MGRLFGTDGIRGIAGAELTCDIAYKLGMAVASSLENKNKKTTVIIGKDTRLSGDMFESAISAGLCTMGSDAVLLGVVPTPAVAYLVRKLGADAGIMISASHNPAEHNGLKVFAANGMKLSDETENAIEEMILGEKELPAYKTGKEIGRVKHDPSLAEMYCDHVKSVIKTENCTAGRKILFDLANGSSSMTAKRIFTSDVMHGFAAEFTAGSPDGININLGCGSTHLEKLAEAVKCGGYYMGFAFDGDADRCLAVDENGETVDGDKIISLLACEMKAEGKLSKDTAVVTSLSNMGFHKMAEENGISVAVTDVGDRYVLEEMIKHGYNIGGEQSGHIILTDHGTTGDGQVTAAAVLSVLARYPDKKASEIFSIMTVYPQVAINVKVSNSVKKQITSDPEVKAAAERVKEKLCGKGRVLLRPSGTEALIRIMLEGEDKEEITKLGEEIAEVVKTRFPL